MGLKGVLGSVQKHAVACDVSAFRAGDAMLGGANGKFIDVVDQCIFEELGCFRSRNAECGSRIERARDATGLLCGDGFVAPRGVLIGNEQRPT